MSFPLRLKRWARWLVPDAIGVFLVNRRLKQQLDYWDTDPSFDDVRALDTEQLEKYLETEWTRAKELDEKLYKLTAALSVAVTLGGVVSKTIFDGLAGTLFKDIVVAFLFLSMGMFLFGALIGFSGLRPKPRYGYGAEYLRIIAGGGNTAADAMKHAASGFQVMNMVRSNEASTAIDQIRNGVLVFTLALGVSFFAPTAGKDASLSLTSAAETTPLETNDLQTAKPIPLSGTDSSIPEPTGGNMPIDQEAPSTLEVLPLSDVPSKEKAPAQNPTADYPEQSKQSDQKSSGVSTSSEIQE